MGIWLSRFFQMTEEQLQSAQQPVFPELETARHQRERLEQAPQTQYMLRRTVPLMDGIERIPQTSYTAYRMFRTTGERLPYETPYFLKRARLAAAAVRLFLGQHALKAVVQDYLWSICEETNWVLPAHEPRAIDLFAAETGFQLAEALHLVGDTLDEELCQRVRTEIERRVFEPYLRSYQLHDWYLKGSNWNGVCNGAIAAAFVLLEPEPARLAQALKIALTGLQAFLEQAFETDGSSTEGVAYWQYGLFNVVALAEMLYARSGGAINLLAVEKMKPVAAFPAKQHLSGSYFASFADCDELVRFHPGIITRLVERTGETSLWDLIADPAELECDWRLAMLLRDILWWDGQQPDSRKATDARLPVGGTARLVTGLDQHVPVVLCVKAGHNDEEHNHNDVGSFLLHVAGENLLTDPGRGLYSRDYFGPQRYDNLFANSYSHSVPRIDGMLQGSGRAFAGTLLQGEMVELDGYKRAAIEFAAAYPCQSLKQARREWKLATEGSQAGTVWLYDHFQFSEQGHEVEEAFVTWLECEVDGATAWIHGQYYDLSLVIEQPQGVSFRLEHLEEACKANQKADILKRLSIVLPRTTTVDMSLRMSVIQSCKG